MTDTDDGRQPTPMHVAMRDVIAKLPASVSYDCPSCGGNWE